MRLTQTNHKKKKIPEYNKRLYTKIPTKYIKLWCADNNGQIATSKESNEVILKWTL